MIARSHTVILLIVGCLLRASDALAVDYTELHARAVKACEAIDASQSQSGLLFNPDGYRSYYVRSKCFQEAAIQYRDPALCSQVKERRSLFSSSWGYTATRCRQLVADGAAANRKELEAIRSQYIAGGMKLRDFRIEQNGNGRDFDIIPAFAGTYARGYTLTFEILPDGKGEPILLHTSGYYVDEKSNLNLYVRQSEIRQRLPGFAAGRSYSVRATVFLDVGFGGQSGYWSPSFVNSVFPAASRSHSIVRRVTF